MESYKGKYGDKPPAPSCFVPSEEVKAPVETVSRQPLFARDEDRKMFQRNIEKLCNIFKYQNDMRNSFGEFGTKLLDNAFSVMKTQMEAADKDRWIEPTGEDKSKVKESMNFLWQVVMDKPITDIIKDISIELSVLAFNWNSVFGKRQDIADQSKTVERLVLMHYTTLDVIAIAKKLSEKAERMLATAPPAYELSDHWLKTLDEELAKREKK